MPQKGKNIYQRKDGRWEGRYIKGRTEAGKAVYGYVYAHTYEEVTKKRDEAADGVDPEKLKKNVPKKDSAEAVAIEWLYSLKPQIKQSTFCKYHTSIYCYIIPELGQKDINDISVMDLQNFCNNLFSTTNTRSKPLSSKTVSDTMSVMRRILHYAYIHGYQPACNGREIVIRKTAPDIVVLSASDQRILCKYLFEHKSRYSDMPVYRNPGRRTLRTEMGGCIIGEKERICPQNHAAVEQLCYGWSKILHRNIHSKKQMLLQKDPASGCTDRLYTGKLS